MDVRCCWCRCGEEHWREGYGWGTVGARFAAEEVESGEHFCCVLVFLVVLCLCLFLVGVRMGRRSGGEV